MNYNRQRIMMFEDTVLLRVVSLRGIRLVASSHQVETDGRVHVRVEGIDEDETPFAFGGAIYPIKVGSFSNSKTMKMQYP